MTLNLFIHQFRLIPKLLGEQPQDKSLHGGMKTAASGSMSGAQCSGS